MSNGITLIDVLSCLPDVRSLDNLLCKFLEYTEKDLETVDLRDDIMALAVGYQTVKLFGFLSEVFSKEPFDSLTGKELSEVIKHSMDYFHSRLDTEGGGYDYI